MRICEFLNTGYVKFKEQLHYTMQIIPLPLVAVISCANVLLKLKNQLENIRFALVCPNIHFL